MNIIKKILIVILFFASLVSIGTNYVYADCSTNPGSAECIGVAGGSEASGGTRPDRGGDPEGTTSRTIDVIVTEEMPGLDCFRQRKNYGSDETGQNYVWEDGTPNVEDGRTRYRCEVPVGMQGALLVLGRLIRFLTSFALICAVLFLVFNGMRLTTAGVDQEAKGAVKKQIIMTLTGIILLLLSGPILRLIAPWVYR